MGNKYDINNFYVGELYLSYSMEYAPVSSKKYKEEKEEKNKVLFICLNGAIDFEKGIMRKYTDWQDGRTYEGILTIFYKDKDKYISLHNGKSYEARGVDFYSNLTPLANLLPKIDYNIPKEISIRQARKMFDILFKSNAKKTDKLYNEVEHSICDYYVGILNLYEGYLKNNDYSERYTYENIPQKQTLFRSDAILSSMHGKKGDSKDESLYDFINFYCLFLRQQNGLYNIHDYQMYDRGTFEYKEYFNNEILDQSYYDFMMPLRDYLEKKDIAIESDSITVPKALKLYRKSNEKGR